MSGQQMHLVQLPIYIRAIYKGFLSAWAGAVHKRDNSSWDSFAKNDVVFVCAMWLAFVVIVMVAAVVGGIVVVAVAAAKDGWQGVMDVAIPEAYGMAMSCVWIWVSRRPLAHMLKDNVPNISSRIVDTTILLLMFVFTFATFGFGPVNTLFSPLKSQ